jgi:LysR family transcriptional activator of nhaA
MKRLNYQHLYYFWMVAKHGSISAACDILHLSQPTISAQLINFQESLGTILLQKKGRKLELTDTGQTVFHYAEEIFSIGRELSQVLKNEQSDYNLRLNLGLADALPKLLAYRLIQPLLQKPEKVHIQCFENKSEQLIADISLHHLDIVLADAPADPSSHKSLINHFLGESGIAIFATPSNAFRYRQNFPAKMNNAPILLPTSNTALRRSLNQWFEQNGIKPNIRAEIEDSALLKTCGSAGMGLFFAPMVVADEIKHQYGVEVIKQIDGVTERYYAITAQRKIKNPAVQIILDNAKQRLFGCFEHD